MTINHIVVHLQETKKVVLYLQAQIKNTPRRGFWLVSLAAFLVSPFLTNDGCCLLFVEVILDAFSNCPSLEDERIEGDDEGVINNDIEEAPKSEENVASSIPPTLRIEDSGGSPPKPQESDEVFPLSRSDSMYFLLSLACSSNIGSALTYTGNPQNMIVASDSLSVLPPWKFLFYMLLPSITAWLMTTWWIERCWLKARTEKASPSHLSADANNSFLHRKIRFKCLTNNLSDDASREPESNPLVEGSKSATVSSSAIENFSSSASSSSSKKEKSMRVVSSHDGNKKKTPINLTCGLSVTLEHPQDELPTRVVSSPLSPRRKQAKARAETIKKIVNIIKSPVPYIAIVILFAMIIMIFVDVMSISGLVCVTAIVMTVTLVMGNHLRGQPIYSSWNNETNTSTKRESNEPITQEEKIENLNEFFEELFNSIDYNILIIFIGLFIVVANVDSTGLPKRIWQGIVGAKPFNTVASVFGISVFVLVTSQLLGNVAVVQLALPNVTSLDDNSKRYAWAVISFVATVGGI